MFKETKRERELVKEREKDRERKSELKRNVNIRREREWGDKPHIYIQSKKFAVFSKHSLNRIIMIECQ